MTYSLETGPKSAVAHLLIAHGAGAGIDSPLLQTLAERLGSLGLHVIRFEFEYMASRRTGGKKRPPPRAEKLTEEYAGMVASVSERLGAGERLFIGGKSLGGRVASLIADEAFRSGDIAGLFCLGYPFHPPGKSDRLRTAHLVNISCPTLIVQGTRDPFGSKDEVAALKLSRQIRVHWVGDGDHDFRPRAASGFTLEGNLEDAADAVSGFIQGRR